MKLDKIRFARVIAFIGRQFNDAELSELDSLIDIEHPRAMTADQCKDLMLALVNSRKIDAIKLVREVYGYGLKEARDFVEENYFYLVNKPSENNEGATLGDILGQATRKDY